MSDKKQDNAKEAPKPQQTTYQKPERTFIGDSVNKPQLKKDKPILG
ncbi:MULTISPECIES: hypothetical protein [Pasteurellaceae]|uniref:Uncharacterized protein n=1 Tax=Pasteurella atlantica TaxID=2827233 RepID=A0AAW8CMU6_9PAST|nr:hypothetical protein [Pasteurella atlantica]MBR0574175.1 hypothetical protein [Pasteurella atlantica]MDP8039284.1 hypothetical protein [Pasteurella atlantica]MDP8041376.1 hypothetical protein [Pasteurella atlantica]MDP8043512.1 hypothetical protein [Pasteurella atlantica]MDP8045570.1 hypothetical protein [Pasteurella atlantica]